MDVKRFGLQEESVAPELQTLLKHRAERLKEQKSVDDDEAVISVAEFPVGEEQFAIPLNTLRAAVPLKMVTLVPLSAPHVIGVLRFQGQIITALSLASLLGGRGWRTDPAILLIVDPGWEQVVALDCEQIPKPTALPVAAVEEARGRSQGAVLEIATRDMRQVNLIDLGRLLDRRTGGLRHGN